MDSFIYLDINLEKLPGITRKLYLLCEIGSNVIQVDQKETGNFHGKIIR